MNRGWNLQVPLRQGQASRQAHADLPDRSFERELGRHGFFGAATQMYHRNPPVAWTGARCSCRSALPKLPRSKRTLI